MDLLHANALHNADVRKTAVFLTVKTKKIILNKQDQKKETI
jgi:hypothetical protein